LLNHPAPRQNLDSTMVKIMPRITNLTLGFIILSATLFSGTYAQSQTSEECESAITEMGYPVGNHVFQRGGLFSNDRHVFGNIVCEVSARGEIRKIERDGQVLAQDGIFGLGALQIRREVEQTTSDRLTAARQARDQAIEAARVIYEETRQEERRGYTEIERIELSMLDTLLQGLRDGEINETAALHFNISSDFLAEFEEEEFFLGLRERRERERLAEQARAEEEAREQQRERDRREAQRHQREAQRLRQQESEMAEHRAREMALGVPIEPDADFPRLRPPLERELLQHGRIGIQLIRERGWACASVSALLPFFSGGGISIRCNHFRYHYELRDRGGRWVIELR